MKIEVVKFDNLGRGIGYINNKIIFIPKTVPNDIVEVDIIKEYKNYYIGKLKRIIKPSKLRINSICPYYLECGGCHLQNISIIEALDFKLNKVNDILKQNKIDYIVRDILKCSNNYNYRNKVSLKINNSKVGFYKEKTHKLISIDYCYLVNDSINDLIKDITKLNITEGDITIRCNYKNELLLILNTNSKLDNIDLLINNHKLVGIINNEECIYGEDYLIENINDYLFKISYNSFFQVNPYITSKLFNLVKVHTKDSNKLLDLYCGVGSLGIVSASKNVLGVEIVKNAIKDALVNKNFNNKNNCEFICADTKDIINKIDSSYDTIILDPPRSGVNKKVLNKIIDSKINNIIYISCNINTLARDLNDLLNDYNIKDFILLDMFPNTHHIESFCVLKLF